MKEQRFPPGWDEKKVREVLAHYESQSEDEEFAEIESALDAENITMVAVPTNLVPKVQELIARDNAK
jgi:O-phosphoseryl-tRNA(Cys) synthetase